MAALAHPAGDFAVEFDRGLALEDASVGGVLLVERALAGVGDHDPLAVRDGLAFEQAEVVEALEPAGSGLVRGVEVGREVRTRDLDLAVEPAAEREVFEGGELVVSDRCLGCRRHDSKKVVDSDKRAEGVIHSIVVTAASAIRYRSAPRAPNPTRI